MKLYTLLLGVVIVLGTSCGKKRESILPETTEITESVYASGKVLSQDQYTVYSTVNGILQRIHIREGDSIQKGQLLFELESSASGLQSENARLAMELTEQNNRQNSDKLQEMEWNVRMARDKMRLDSAVYFKQRALWNQKIGSEIELEQKKLSYQNALAAYEVALKRLRQLSTQLKNERDRARVNFDLSQKNLTDFRINSAIDGKIYSILKEEGELITPQMPLAVLGASGQFYIELDISETDINKIRIGQIVLLTLDSYRDKVFQAKVSGIAPFMNDRTRNFTVEALFLEKPEQLFPNLTVEANILIQTKKNALTIPADYLTPEGEVWVGKKEKRKVKTGLKDNEKVEILEGLSKGEKIYKPL